MQELYQERKDDCFATAVACITGEDRDTMPVIKGGPCMDRLHKDLWLTWQIKYGWELRFRAGRNGYKRGEYYIGIFKITFLDSSHAVVCKNGKVVHNVQRNPSKGSLEPHPWGIVTVKDIRRKHG